ncbi:MAG: hypothetical protein ACRCVT_01145, partial [Leadbetterella sp.]
MHINIPLGMTQRLKSYLTKFFLILLLIIVIAVLGIWIYFNTDLGKAYIQKTFEETLSETLDTPVKGTLSYSIPNWIRVDNLLVLDNTKDTLVYSQKAYLEVDMLDLFYDKITSKSVELQNSKIFVSKKKGDFNFDHILKKLNKKDPNKKSKSFELTFDKINLKNTSIAYTSPEEDQNIQVIIQDLTTGFYEINPSKITYKLRNTTLTGLE